MISGALLVYLILFYYHGGLDATGIKLLIFGVTSAFGAAYFCCKYQKLYKSNYSSKLIIHIFFIGILHAIIILLELTSYGLWMQDIFVYSDKSLQTWDYRPSGLLYSGFGALSISQAMTGFFGLILIFLTPKYYYNDREVIYISTGILIIVSSIICTGRVGLIIFILSLPIFFTINLLIFYKNINKLVVLFFTFLIGLFAIQFFSDYDAGQYSKILVWSFELYYRFTSTGEIGTGSTDILFNQMFFIPESIADIWFGTGNFGVTPINLETDVGYVQEIFGGGIVGLVSILSIFLYFFYISIINLFCSPIISNCLLFSTILLTLSNFKDPSFFNIYGSNQIIFIIFSLLAMKNTYGHVIDKRGSIYLDNR
jgi:hypothetical protein